jgi:cell division protein FtsN
MKMPENTIFRTNAQSRSSSVVNGPLLVTLAALLILILGGMYYWLTALNAPAPVAPAVERPTAVQNNEPESTTAEAQTETSQAVSTSDELPAIEADLEATNLESMETEMEAIDAEMKAE